MKDLIEQSNVESSVKQAATELLELDTQCYHLKRISALLSWDQELNMPRSGAENRAEQLAFLEVEIHRSITQHRVAECLRKLGVTESNQLGNSSLNEKIRLWLRTKYREWKKHSSLPPKLLADFKKECSLAFLSWCEAKKQNDYTLFKDKLQSIVSFNQEIADCLGYGQGKDASRYDALLDQFEPGVSSQHLTQLFSSLQETISPLYRTLWERSREAKLPPLPQVPVTQQRKMTTALAAGLGFNREKGHIGESVHPFSVGLGPRDARITTRYLESNPLTAIFSILHEMGHAFYELGFSPVYSASACADGASYGIHESQSRFFENILGKNLSFWEHWYPVLQKTMPAFAEFTLDDFIAQLRTVNKSPIRIEADELSYNLHIIVRFEIEKALIEKKLSVDDAPVAWNEKYRQYLDIEPGNDAEGILQDVHWSEGYFGYFPSYALGNLYAAELYYRMPQEIPKYQEQLRQGSIAEILNWLRSQIHQHGASKLPQELLPLQTEAFFRYAREQYL